MKVLTGALCSDNDSDAARRKGQKSLRRSRWASVRHAFASPTRPHSGTDRFGLLVRALERRDELNGAERNLIRQLPTRLREFEAGEELVSEYSEPSESCLLVSGLAARAQFVANGSRQLTAVHVPGDFVDLHSLMLKVMDHSVVALTRVQAAFVPHRSLLSVMEAAP